MEILPPKYIGDGVLPDAKYPEFWRLIDIQGLRPFLFTRGRYPHFVAAAFTTIFIREDKDDGEEFALGFCLGGREYKFTLTTLATAWGLKDEGDTFRTWNKFSKATAVRDLHLSMLRQENTQSAGCPPTIISCCMCCPMYCSLGRAIMSGSFLALAHLWTGLFEMAPLDLSREEVVNPGSANIITSKNIN
ncbi:hypothetical protein PIB30_094666 [Stylosanthes scabra]|uniref:Uncharacterized protein n=1 Tax=Stylosanthes scabra TaxID=79078 RepID=A0ABU6RVX3_9FABA|nr:hypothetical protein [Stylosanthes scabra]